MTTESSSSFVINRGLDMEVTTKPDARGFGAGRPPAPGAGDADQRSDPGPFGDRFRVGPTATPTRSGHLIAYLAVAAGVEISSTDRPSCSLAPAPIISPAKIGRASC